MKIYQKSFTGIVMLIHVLLFPFISVAQRSDRGIADKEKKEIIEKVISILKDKYIFPEKVPAIQKTVNEKLSSGQYSKFGTVEEFLKNLNVDLETLSNDRHVDVFFDPVVVGQIVKAEKDTAAQTTFSPQFLARAQYENFMVKNVERLDGNIGYLKFNQFMDLQIARSTLIAAMNVLTHSSALIIDLRQNGGGHSETVEFLLNYFLPDSTLVGSFTSRLDNTTRNIYTRIDPAIKKFPADIPVYILTGKRTSSAAEAFTYTLQSFKRATIIGDTTNGEANPGYRFALNTEMYLMVPAFINRNPITKTNWQGIGVIPDVKISASKALLIARVMGYKQLSISSVSNDMKFFYEWMATGLQAEIDPVKLTEKELLVFAGSYADNRRISFENGTLYYQRVGISEKKKLSPLTPDTFSLEGNSFFRIHFIKNESGKTTALEGIYDDGKKELSKIIE